MSKKNKMIKKKKKKYVHSERGRGPLKAHENIQGEGGRGKAYVHYKKIVDSVIDFRPHIKHVSNLLISCLASNTHLLAGFKSMTCK